MFHPVGSRPPSVYWRRRFVLLASVIAVLALLAITVKVLVSNGPGGAPAAGGTPGTSTRTSQGPHPSAPTTRSSSSRHSTSAGPANSTTRSTSASSPNDPPSSSASGPAQPCAPANLALAALTNKAQYKVGEQLTLSIRVTNKGKSACVVDLGDPQVLLKVYNGESRVWGSHDCQVTPGKVERTLMARQAVKVSIVWSGLSARPNCAGPRQRVGAGSYTLEAFLAGHRATVAQFAIK